MAGQAPDKGAASHRPNYFQGASAPFSYLANAPRQEQASALLFKRQRQDSSPPPPTPATNWLRMWIKESELGNIVRMKSGAPPVITSDFDVNVMDVLLQRMEAAHRKHTEELEKKVEALTTIVDKLLASPPPAVTRTPTPSPFTD